MTGKKWIILGIVVVASTLLASALLVATVAAEPPPGSSEDGPDATGSGRSQAVAAPSAVGTGFTYQGQLKDGEEPVSANCEMAFRLYDQATGGSQVGSVITTTVPISDGLFTASLDFGSGAFAGDARWLAVRVRCPGDGSYTALTPRQPLTPAPYALYASQAPWSGLAGVPAGFADGVDNNTTYSAGTGLTLSGTQFRITTAYRLPQSCTGGQIAEWNGSVWACGDDDTGTSGSTWSLSGNAGTTPGTHFLGTTDEVSLTLAVNGAAALRLEPSGTSPNLIGGYGGNSVAPGAVGATIGGGGSSGDINQATADYATVGGGAGNTASDSYTTVGGGYNNAASNNYTTVGGGGGNAASGARATVGGGVNNDAGGVAATVGGGNNNAASNNYATVGGGQDNTASGGFAAVGGGEDNTASGSRSTVGGGRDNSASDSYATVGGGQNNTASVGFATVGGGQNNTAGNGSTTVGGGYNNAANGSSATIGGGQNNTANGHYATVGGGNHNDANWNYATIGGGGDNTASDGYATVGGGEGNAASSDYATIGGGEHISVTGEAATVAGGSWITVTGDHAAVGGGRSNTASGNYATVGGGRSNTAGGYYSFAAGRRAKANNQGCFVWGDSTDADVACNNNNRWVARASGGVYFYTSGNQSTGVYLPSGGETWQQVSASDRNLKENFSPVDGQQILGLLADIPITTWNYKASESGARHISPMAQDFYAAFEVGEDDKHLRALDVNGVALAAIQGLYQQNQALQQQNADLEARVAALEAASANTPPQGSQLDLLPWAGVLLAVAGLAWAFHRRDKLGSFNGGGR
jgi:hypothetical protein